MKCAYCLLIGEHAMSCPNVAGMAAPGAMGNNYKMKGETMIAKIKAHTLTDKSKVYDIEIEESGVTMVSIPCGTEQDAKNLLFAFEKHTLVKVIR